jgi:hypothetical protein
MSLKWAQVVGRHVQEKAIAGALMMVDGVRSKMAALKREAYSRISRTQRWTEWECYDEEKENDKEWLSRF